MTPYTVTLTLSSSNCVEGIHNMETKRATIPLTCEEKKQKTNKKHSENADTSTSVTFDLDLTSKVVKT